MKLITIQLADGNEIHAHVQSERQTDEGTDMLCVDENGSMFKVVMWEIVGEPLDK